MPSIVGEALHLFGTPEQKERWLRLATIWTGTNEIMSLIVQHEYYQEVLRPRPGVRDEEEKEF